MVRQPASAPESLYKRLGGYDVIAAGSDDFLAWSWADKQLGRFFTGHSEGSFKELRQHVVNLFCELTGGSCVYMGRDMIADDLFVAALKGRRRPLHPRATARQATLSARPDAVFSLGVTIEEDAQTLFVARNGPCKDL